MLSDFLIISSWAPTMCQSGSKREAYKDEQDSFYSEIDHNLMERVDYE